MISNATSSSPLNGAEAPPSEPSQASQNTEPFGPSAAGPLDPGVLRDLVGALLRSESDSEAYRRIQRGRVLRACARGARRVLSSAASGVLSQFRSPPPAASTPRTGGVAPGQGKGALAKNSPEVPGVIGAFSAPLAVGIPITAQGLADRVVLITGDSEAKSQDSTPEFDPAATVIWLQETDSLHGLARALIREGGYPTNWPVAVVERSGQPGRRAVRAPLHAIAAVVAQAGLEAPVAIVMGSVVRRAEASGFELDADGAVEVAVA